MAKPRVHELAKEFGVTSKEVIAKLGEMNEFVKGPSSTLNPMVVKKLREAFPAANLQLKQLRNLPHPRKQPPVPLPRRNLQQSLRRRNLGLNLPLRNRAVQRPLRRQGRLLLRRSLQLLSPVRNPARARVIIRSHRSRA